MATNKPITLPHSTETWFDGDLDLIESAIFAQFDAITSAVAGRLLTGCGIVVNLRGDRDAVDLDEVHAWAKLYVVPVGIELLVQWNAKEIQVWPDKDVPNRLHFTLPPLGDARCRHPDCRCRRAGGR